MIIDVHVVPLQVSKKMVHSHSFSLTNLTLSNLTFRVLSPSEPLMVSMNNEEVYSTLKPRETIEVRAN